jgi:pimeloyl-ACP methyl ester carboxylesterase
MSQRPAPLILLPGGIMPAGPAYGPLAAELGADADARPKELEVYAGDAPPPGWSLATEVAGIDRAADAAGFERFHLAGYSAGGASSIAYAIARPDRLLSLAIMEPAFAGWAGMGPEERAHFLRFRAVAALPDAEQLAAFQDLQIAPGVPRPVPPPGPPPPWMAKRPAGIRAILGAFLDGDLDQDALRGFDRPVWFALGGRSHPDYYPRMAERLARVLPDVTLEVFPDRHHFDPPHRIEPARVAASLRALWGRADAAG